MVPYKVLCFFLLIRSTEKKHKSEVNHTMATSSPCSMSHAHTHITPLSNVGVDIWLCVALLFNSHPILMQYFAVFILICYFIS